MAENLTPEDYRAEIAALNHEIYILQTKIEQQNARQQKEELIDKYDPFCNPTEYPDFCGDYSEIVPQIEIPGCKIPVEPSQKEKKRLRHYYNIGGANMAFHLIFTLAASSLLIFIVMLVLQLINPDVSYEVLYDYAYGSSIMAGISAIVYLIANVLFSYIGFKWSKVKFSSLIHTRDFSFGKAVQYCFTAIFIQYAAALICMGFSDIIEKYGFSTDISTEGYAETAAGLIISSLYACIIAPITEELFFRGMLLRTFGRANQRFAIIASSAFFGLAHGNLPQFLLAFLLGIFLAHIDLKHGSLIPSVIVHMFINTSATVLNYITDHSGSLAVTTVLNMVYLLISLVGLIMLIEFRSKNKLPSTTPHQSRRGFPVAVTSFTVTAAFIGEFLLTLFTILMTKYS